MRRVVNFLSLNLFTFSLRLKRDWIYHKKFQRWFKIEDPKNKKAVYEEVKSFDPKVWELQIIKSVELDPKDLLTKFNFEDEIKKPKKKSTYSGYNIVD